MYTTKLLNKNIVQGGQYITIGDDFKDPKPNIFRQPEKDEKVPTPFIVKKHPAVESKPVFNNSVFKETTQYLATQALDKRPMGFGTRDAFRRDEFTNGMRSEQYRECIKKENQSSAKSSVQATVGEEQLEILKESMKCTTPSTEEFPYHTTVSQYDIGRNQVTEFDPKSTRDRYYRFATNREKYFGPYRPSSADFGDGAWASDYRPPSHGPKAQIKNFFDKSHLKV